MQKRKGAVIIKVDAFQKLFWPQFCILCLKKGVIKDFNVIGGGHIPYCKECHIKVERLQRWKDSIFIVAGIIGIIGGILSSLIVLIQEGINGLGRAVAFFPGTLIMIFILFYSLFYLTILPLRLIFHSRLVSPGVKVLKSKKPGIMVLKFTNVEYADIFRRINSSSIRT